ncbi:hypothetical protein K493DRAFT_29301 [Basidiobolus meristosporus CBS 931.73]|uniref:TFIIB-type domain-containing protein n=1 Tax=Basidiobolus meristosporus CBS 931.73 TaxID=1314790 RepID=A0A1Y1ZEC5_9FUNG|nr:hypothetical protein K493DRAFT_29301 [Basidiobolus meristosporus CBS 931.73]|eukprot:ORY08317.1 hypothetical protein K493DRAFT_29301 [Basidiobolus meristosporus CBS 931.73]
MLVCSCGSTDIIEDAQLGANICASCGLVLDENTITTNDGGEFDGQTHVNNKGVPYSSAATGSWVQLQLREKNQYRLYLVHLFIDKLTSMLHLNSYSERTKHLYASYIQQAKGPRYGRKGELIGAACLYIAIREEEKGLGLDKVASAAQCNAFLLGRIYCQVKTQLNIVTPEIDPCLFVEAVLSQVYHQVNESYRRYKFQELSLHKVLELCGNALNILKEAGVAIGRRPKMVACASILLVIEGLEQENLAKSFLDIIVIASGCPVQAIKQRYKEGMEVMIKYANRLPWGGDITKKNIYQHLLDVINYFEVISSQSPLPSPQPSESTEDTTEKRKLDQFIGIPSYQRSLTKKQKRLPKITSAENRIKDILFPTQHKDPEDSAASYDEDSLLIQRLLLHKIPKDRLTSDSLKNLRSLAQGIVNDIQKDPESDELLSSSEQLGYFRTEHEIRMVLKAQPDWCAYDSAPSL